MIFQNFIYGELENISKFVEWKTYDKLPEASEEYEGVLGIISGADNTQHAYICKKVKGTFKWVLIFDAQEEYISSVNPEYFNVKDGKLDFIADQFATRKLLTAELEKKQDIIEFGEEFDVVDNVVHFDTNKIDFSKVDLSDNESIILINSELIIITSEMIPELFGRVDAVETIAISATGAINRVNARVDAEVALRDVQYDELVDAIDNIKVETSEEIKKVKDELDAKFTINNTLILNEIVDRAEAEAELEELITSEISKVKDLIVIEEEERKLADSELKVLILEEILKRSEGDSELLDKILKLNEKVDSEAQNCLKRYSDLKDYTDSEIIRLTDLIDSETAARIDEDAKIYEYIDSEIIKLVEAINSETILRIEEDGKINARIDSEVDKLMDYINLHQLKLIPGNGIDLDDDSNIAVKIDNTFSGLKFEDEKLDVNTYWGLQRADVTGAIMADIGDGLKFKYETTAAGDITNPVMVNLGEGLCFEAATTSEETRKITIAVDGKTISLAGGKLSASMTEEIAAVREDTAQEIQQTEDKIMTSVSDAIKSAYTMEVAKTSLDIYGVKAILPSGNPERSTTKLAVGNGNVSITIDDAEIFNVAADKVEIPGTLKAKDLEVEKIRVGGWIIEPKTTADGKHILDFYYGG